ncbi:hypothetical protein OV090_23845 [Nannocystis sp. RBIL2]|uniref:hypothetical protein n=1 Tax=Nannocystis sp. RBIL2 TaxID=2996788 RepID=UPI00226DBBD5|nr:hypothetical protein [Nannocystis sp. RBIL2]MCY1067795.1 hypothetical protein [Nannocystis sp. RBIL2]
MPKNLTLVAIAGIVVSTGCVINTNTTDSDSETSDSVTGNTTTDATTTDGTTTESTTDGTATGDTDTTTTNSTTTAPTTTETEPTSTTSTATTDDTTASTTGSGFGKCGWDPNNKYYACDFVGEEPGGVSPIECPETLPAEGDDCDENSPVTGIGCCLPDGSNYYCTDQGKIAIDACGA